MHQEIRELTVLPCQDSSEMAEARRTELSIPREKARHLGHSAVEIARNGYYCTPTGRHVDCADAVQAACDAKRSIAPDAELPAASPRASGRTLVQISNETTLGVARRFFEDGLRPLALNFANGIHPGGGFLHGARAQEEVLCRSSALYRTLESDPMYDAHAQRPEPDSTDWAILSPEVPVFRVDDGRELESPWPLSFITCAAPYAPAIGQPESGNLLRQRIRRTLAVAHAYGYTALVLGAWGCGAFGNDPQRTAADFREALETTCAGAFSHAFFAIADWSPERRFLGPFRRVFDGA